MSLAENVFGVIRWVSFQFRFGARSNAIIILTLRDPDSAAVPTLELRNTAAGIASHQVRIGQKPDDLARFDLGDRFAELHQPIGFDQR